MDFTHIPSLFVLNKGRDGRFNLSDLQQFCHLCLELSTEFHGYEREMQLRATCALKMYNVLKLPEGLDVVQNWYVDVLFGWLVFRHGLFNYTSNVFGKYLLPFSYSLIYSLSCVCYFVTLARFMKVLQEGKGTTDFEDIPSVVFVDRNLVAELHQVLNTHFDSPSCISFS